MVLGKSTTPRHSIASETSYNAFLWWSDIFHRFHRAFSCFHGASQVLRQEKGFAWWYWLSDQSAVWALWSYEERCLCSIMIAKCLSRHFAQGKRLILRLMWCVCGVSGRLRHNWMAAICRSWPHSDRMPGWPVWGDDLPASILDDELSRTQYWHSFTSFHTITGSKLYQRFLAVMKILCWIFFFCIQQDSPWSRRFHSPPSTTIMLLALILAMCILYQLLCA